LGDGGGGLGGSGEGGGGGRGEGEGGGDATAADARTADWHVVTHCVETVPLEEAVTGVPEVADM